MRVSEKLALIDQLSKIIDEKDWTEREIDAFLREFELNPPPVPYTYDGRAYYAKTGMLEADSKVILRIADDLQVDAVQATAYATAPPENWANTTDFRLFISHVSKSKDKATRLKEALRIHDIAGFVAHEDIEPTKPWQQQIERALYTMDAMVAVHTNGFKDSSWTQQEIGFALGRGVKVISLKMEQEDPTGLISKDQALSRRSRTAEEVAKEIVEILKADTRTSDRLIEAQKLGRIPF